MSELLHSSTSEIDIERTIDCAWQLFRLATETNDRENFQASYLGLFASRASFGEHILIHTYGATEKLQQLPSWLQGYLRVDGDAVADDFERVGHFRLLEAPNTAGVFVFNAGVMRQQ